MATTGLKTISREEFMEACPQVLKQRIDDFFVYYSEKKKNPFSSTSDSSKKFYSKDKFDNKKRPSNTNFRKPFERDSSEIDKFFIDYRGVLSKVNETNLDAIWKELQELHLEKYITDPSKTIDSNDGWAVAGKKSTNQDTTISNNQTEISRALYQYTRTCNMYLKEYIEIVNRMKKSKDLNVYTNEYLQFLYNDLDKPKEDDKEYNILTHQILSECTMMNLVTKKKFIQSGLQTIHQQILKNIEEGESNDEYMDILIQNMKRVGKQIYKQKEVATIIEEMTEWKNSKIFSGRLHFNLMDILTEITKWG